MVRRATEAAGAEEARAGGVGLITATIHRYLDSSSLLVPGRMVCFSGLESYI